MIIDFHTHTFPDQIAASAVARLSDRANIPAYSSGTAGGLLLAERAGPLRQCRRNGACERFGGVNKTLRGNGQMHRN